MNYQFRESHKHYGLLIFCIIVLSVFQILSSNQLIGLTSRLENVRGEIASLEKENEASSEKVASASSLLTLRERVKDLGFTQSPKLLYIQNTHTVAQNR